MASAVNRQPKVFKPVNNCCRLGCTKKIDIYAQERIFNDYVSLKKYAQRMKVLRSVMRFSGTGLGGKVHNRYYLNDDDGNEHKVCLNLVTAILQVSRVGIYRAGASIATNPTGDDRRGKRYKPEDVQMVRQFVEELPLYETTRNMQRSKYKYLHPRINYKALYNVFKQQHEGTHHTVCSYQAFYRMARKTGLKYVKKERLRRLYQCRECQNKPFDNENVMDEDANTKASPKNEHEVMVEESQKRFFQCINTAKKRHTAVLSFELQGALEMPFVSAEESYNWHQLWFSNFCVSDEVRNKVYMYVWDESIAQRRSEEIVSCLFRHIFDTVSRKTRKIILYSDPSDVYRNMTVSLMLKKLFDYWPNKHLRTIEQRFFDYGHNFGKSKRAITAVNSGRTSKSFFGTSDWIEAISVAMRASANFTLTAMNHKQFYSADSLLALVNGKDINVDGEEIVWQSIQCLKYRRSDPFGLSFKSDGDRFTYVLSERNLDEFRAAKLIFSHLKGNKISRAKFESLQNVLPKIPEHYREFYTMLRIRNSNVAEDYALIIDDDVSSCGEDEESEDDLE